jgi:hypothetical protein
MTADEIAAKTNGYKRGEVPVGVEHLTAFIDVQGALLYWMLCGWCEDSYGGSVQVWGDGNTLDGE